MIDKIECSSTKMILKETAKRNSLNYYFRKRIKIVIHSVKEFSYFDCNFCKYKIK